MTEVREELAAVLEHIFTRHGVSIDLRDCSASDDELLRDMRALEEHYAAMPRCDGAPLHRGAAIDGGFRRAE